MESFVHYFYKFKYMYTVHSSTPILKTENKTRTFSYRNIFVFLHLSIFSQRMADPYVAVSNIKSVDSFLPKLESF